MAIYTIKMPDIGEGIAEVELVAWRVQSGDVVAEDQILADVMTDKATVEIPSPVHGTVLALGGAVGEVMAVGAELIRLEVAGAGNVSATPPALTPAPAKAAPVAAEPVAASAPPPLPPKAALEKAPQAAASVRNAAYPGRQSGDKPIASPAVRRQAWELGIDLQYVSGSGAAGRILHQDLQAYADRGANPPSGASQGVGACYAQRNDEVAVPVIGLRRKIAQKMQESKRRIPHFTYVEEIDVTELEMLRARLNARWGAERGRLTPLPLLMRAVVLALRDFPQINARFDDDAGVVTRYGAVHLGIATQTEAGLMVPVLRHAEACDLWASAAELARLAEAARTGKATREELSGSTLTITSLGALGGIVSTPVINAPEVAIVGVNRIVERPMIRGGAVVARQMMNLSSSFDHRVVDGLHAAEFVQALRGLLECPAMLFVE
ncbi:MAG: 2-oxo acid dehydrogenase subunit E2 [Polaromonas sp.]|nr:2-oxo acid dehydrogenase subunit E2 [Polaromonas sp.]